MVAFENSSHEKIYRKLSRAIFRTNQSHSVVKTFPASYQLLSAKNWFQHVHTPYVHRRTDKRVPKAWNRLIPSSSIWLFWNQTIQTKIFDKETAFFNFGGIWCARARCHCFAIVVGHFDVSVARFSAAEPRHGSVFQYTMHQVNKSVRNKQITILFVLMYFMMI